ncbi:hypothetical protein KAH81_07875 [bacterium]|nr:hypothetical protein [bacterium]
MSLYRVIIISVICLSALAFVPTDSYSFENSKLARPEAEPAAFGPMNAIPNGENLPASPCYYRIDPLTGTFRMITGYPIQIEGYSSVNEQNAASALLNFVDSNERLFGVLTEDLGIISVKWTRNRAIVALQQYKNGIPVWGCHLTTMITATGGISFLSNKLIPSLEYSNKNALSEEYALNKAIATIAPTDEPIRIDMLGEYLFPIWGVEVYSLVGVWAFDILTKDPVGLWRVIVDGQSGSIISISNELRTAEHSGNVYGKYHSEFKDDPLETSAWEFARVTLNTIPIYTDISGNWATDISAATPTYSTSHYGRYAHVDNDAGSEALYNVASFTSPFNHSWTTSSSPDDEMNAYYHVNVIHNYVKDTLGFSSMDYSMPVTVNYSGMDDNANWDGYGINFGGGATIFYDMVLFCDVIYHEYTHGVTHNIYPSSALPYSGQSGAIDEALSDYFACSKTENPLMGDGGLYRSGTAFMRRVNGPKVFPGDFYGEVHADGEIISACWWPIREELGRYFTDSLVHLSRFLYPEDFEEFFWATVNIDDDDGNIYNGTPNGRLIYESYYAHGIGPGFNIEVNHRALNNTEDTTGTYRVEATFNATLGVAADSIGVFWRVDSGPWSYLSMADVFGVFKAYVPAQRRGSTIDYYIIAEDNGGNPLSSPHDAPDSWHTFHVIIDSTVPTISALPIGPWFEYAWPPSWIVNISDDQGISLASIYGRIGTVDLAPQPLTETDVWDVWSGVLPGMPSGGDTVDYWAVAFDNSVAHHVASFPPSGSFKVYIYPGYLEDFEVPGRGYSSKIVSVGYTNEWTRVSQNNPWTDGDYCFYFGSGSEYSDQADGALSTPDLNLGTVAYLKFWHTMDAEDEGSYQAWDGGIVEVSIDGGELWHQVEPQPGYNRYIRDNPDSPFEAGTPCYSSSFAWRKDSLDLSLYAPRARVRFRFGSDAHVTAGGWYIDDIELVTNISDIDEYVEQPEKLSLNFAPNPFNASLSIEIQGNAEPSRLEIFDISGRSVRSFDLAPKQGCIIWDGKDHLGEVVSGGVYLIKVANDRSEKTKKAILIK